MTNPPVDLMTLSVAAARAAATAERKAKNEADAAAKQAKSAAEAAAMEKTAREVLLANASDYPRFSRIKAHPDENLVRVRAEVGFNHVTVLTPTDPDPAISAAVRSVLDRAAEIDRERAEQSARAALLDSLPGAPQQMRASVTPDGRIVAEIPPTPYADNWSKIVTDVNARAANGMAFEGVWAKVGADAAVPPGAIVVSGSKEWQGSRRAGSYVKSRGLYVLCQAGYIPLKSNEAAEAARYLAMTEQERIVAAATERLDTAAAKIDKLRPAAADPTFAAVADEIGKRLEAWETLRAALQSAVAAATAEPAITDAMQAALAIVSAGYRALAAKHHPDQGGDAATMMILNEAREALMVIVKMAQEGKI